MIDCIVLYAATVTYLLVSKQASQSSPWLALGVLQCYLW